MCTSLAFISVDAANSAVVANLALAIAEGGTRVLAVDAADGSLTALLLPGSTTADGFEQVLVGQRTLTDCVQPNTWNAAITVLGSGPTTPERVTGAAYARAVDKLLAAAKASFDVILIDSPALLRVADATQLVDASDAAIIVLSPVELIRDHLEMATRLGLIESYIVGYIYKRARRRFYSARIGAMVSPEGPLARWAGTLHGPPSRLPQARG